MNRTREEDEKLHLCCFYLCTMRPAPNRAGAKSKLGQISSLDRAQFESRCLERPGQFDRVLGDLAVVVVHQGLAELESSQLYRFQCQFVALRANPVEDEQHLTKDNMKMWYLLYATIERSVNSHLSYLIHNGHHIFHMQK